MTGTATHYTLGPRRDAPQAEIEKAIKIREKGYNMLLSTLIHEVTGMPKADVPRLDVATAPLHCETIQNLYHFNEMLMEFVPLHPGRGCPPQCDVCHGSSSASR